MRIRTVVLGAALGLVAGCFDADILENELCASGDDCASSQECVKTPLQVESSGNGWCRDKGSGCAEGEQPGCGCMVNPDGITASCTSSLVASDPMDPQNCVCQPPEAGSTG